MTNAWPPRAMAAVVMMVLAGCAGAPDEPSGSDSAAEEPEPTPGSGYAAWADLVGDMPCDVEGFPLTDTTANLRTVGFSGLNELSDMPTRGEMDVHGTMGVVALYQDEGFTLVNLTDPLEPVELGFWLSSEDRSTYDVKFSVDGDYVYVGFVDRVSIVDVTDPSGPTEVQTLMNPDDYSGQSHMVYPYIIDGREVLFVVPSISGTGLMVIERTETESGPSLSHLAVHTSTAPHAIYPQSFAPHDVYITEEEGVGVVLWLANGFSGLVALGVDDPTDPVTLSSVPPQTRPGDAGSTPTHYHSVQVVWLSDRRIVVTTSEVGYNTMKIYDFTDFDAPEFLGYWIRDESQPAALQHNIQILDGKMLMAHYEHGLFVFDLAAYAQSPTELVEPAGHWDPEAASGLIWDVVVKDGLVFVTDISQGLHVIAYGCFEPGDVSLTSRG